MRESSQGFRFVQTSNNDGDPAVGAVRFHQTMRILTCSNEKRCAGLAW